MAFPQSAATKETTQCIPSAVHQEIAYSPPQPMEMSEHVDLGRGSRLQIWNFENSAKDAFQLRHNTSLYRGVSRSPISREFTSPLKKIKSVFLPVLGNRRERAIAIAKEKTNSLMTNSPMTTSAKGKKIAPRLSNLSPQQTKLLKAYLPSAFSLSPEGRVQVKKVLKKARSRKQQNE